MSRLWVVAAVIGANLAVVAVVGLGLELEAVAAIIAVLAGLAVFQRPQRGLLLLALALPFDGLRIPLGLPGWTANWIEGLVLMTVVAAFVARPGHARPLPGRAWPGWWVGLAGLALLGVLSIRFVDPYQVIVGLKVGFQPVAMAYVAWRCPLSGRERDRLVTILMTVGAICATWGLVQQGLGHARLHEMGYKYNSTIRFSGSFLRSFSTFAQPFPFAFFLMIVVLVGIPIALNDPGRLRNRIFLILLPVYGLGMLAAVVRGAWIGCALGLLWLGIRRYRILLLGIPVVLVFALFVGPDQSSNATSAASGQTRVKSWTENLYEIGDHPLGVGIGSAGAASAKVNLNRGGTKGYQFDALGTEGVAYQPDNQYFLYALELGLAGLWCYILILVSAFRTAVHASERTSGDDVGLALGTGAVVLAYAVAGVVATILEILPVYYFWLLIGVASALAPQARQGGVPAVAMRGVRAGERTPTSPQPAPGQP